MDSFSVTNDIIENPFLISLLENMPQLNKNAVLFVSKKNHI